MRISRAISFRYAVLAALFFGRLSPGEETVADWPIFRGSASLDGRSKSQLRLPLHLRWRFSSGGQSTASPVVQSGVVFVGADNGRFCAVSAVDGQSRWNVDLGAGISCPALVHEGSVYVGDDGGCLHALDVTAGHERWTFRAEDKILGGVNTVPLGTEHSGVVFGSYDMRIYCLDAVSGRKIWSFATANYINGAPAVTPLGIVFGGCDGFLRLLSGADGTEIRSLDLGSYLGGSPAADGKRAFMGSFAGDMVAADMSAGQVLWRFTGSSGSPFFAPPAIGDEVLVAGCRDGAVYGIGIADGQQRWVFRTGGEVDGGSVVSGHRVVFGSEDGWIYVLNTDTGQAEWSYEVGPALNGSPAVVGGMIIFGAADGFVYALGPDDTQPE